MSARATATKAATRREVEQSIARFEKRLDDANTALQALGGHLGRGAQTSYKDVTAAMRALRRDAVKANRQALKDFDKLRAALTKANSSGPASSSTARSASTRSATKRSTGTRSTAAKSGTRSAGSRSSASRSSGTRSTGTRAKSTRSGGKS